MRIVNNNQSGNRYLRDDNLASANIINENYENNYNKYIH